MKGKQLYATSGQVFPSFRKKRWNEYRWVFSPSYKGIDGVLRLGYKYAGMYFEGFDGRYVLMKRNGRLIELKNIYFYNPLNKAISYIAKKLKIKNFPHNENNTSFKRSVSTLFKHIIKAKSINPSAGNLKYREDVIDTSYAARNGVQDKADRIQAIFDRAIRSKTVHVDENCEIVRS